MASADGDGGNVAIGQQDQRRDQAMQQEQQRQDAPGHGADPFETPAEQRGEAEDHEPDAVSVAGDPADEDYHPGQARQPDRETAEGLTGTGPAQPD